MDVFFSILKILKAIIFFVPLIGGLHFFLYSKSPKYYFKYSKFTSKWKDTNWDISAGFKINKGLNFYDAFEKVLKNSYGNNFRRPFNLKNKKLYEFGDFAVTIQYDMDLSQDDFVDVEFLFSNLNVTFNAAEKKLKELRVFFHELEKEIKNVDQWYNINIKFKSLKNPFFGLMIQRLGEEHVEYFECLFPLSIFNKKHGNDSENTNQRLRVFKEQISINESKFDIVEDVAKTCLLLR